MGQTPIWATRRADACSLPRRCPRADCLGDMFVPRNYHLRAELTSSRGALPGSTGFSPMSGPNGGLAQMGVNPSKASSTSCWPPSVFGRRHDFWMLPPCQCEYTSVSCSACILNNISVHIGRRLGSHEGGMQRCKMPSNFYKDLGLVPLLFLSSSLASLLSCRGSWFFASFILVFP